MSHRDHSHNFGGLQYWPAETVRIIESKRSEALRFWLVEVEGERYRCTVQRGRAVRIAFKPRGENRGYRWHGFVERVRDRRELLRAPNCGKSKGPLSLLHQAGIINWRFERKESET